jgi:hypothetical protein
VTLALVLGLAAPALARDLVRPAELPPASYRGQQYIDSKGCLFMRAGTPENVLWLPRVTRDGVPLCGNPPSGNRVPVVEEGATVATEAPAPVAAAEAPAPAAAGGYFVAVGSFGVAENATRAADRLQALNYAVAQSRLQGGRGLVTVFAGPFTTEAEAARARGELVKLGFPDAIVVNGP